VIVCTIRIKRIEKIGINYCNHKGTYNKIISLWENE